MPKTEPEKSKRKTFNDHLLRTQHSHTNWIRFHLALSYHSTYQGLISNSMPRSEKKGGKVLKTILTYFELLLFCCQFCLYLQILLGPFWTLFGPYLDLFGPFSSIFGPLNSLFEPFLDHFEHFGTISDYFRTTFEPFKSFGPKFRTLSAHFEAHFWPVLGQFWITFGEYYPDLVGSPCMTTFL